ncbi:UDP-glucose/GDP-mannose dehydrogenase [Methanococcus vannielii SB]|uniref:UDP-N-acetyl-D-mannosamine dehydrogenase n=1 Tax=Methanococcus vannielii (strain ATCC 35089 / DSM 1224 / JCM 13029 / OCM 148 / SB) TaxID=406327 RepID=WECC_METVS|nr:nucleotide sugar dehydrogenase [Methanococcus vannielii]A6USK4.1 RecName: Full=UDP-N-acetyl-D-mannosamine dehydrogenase; AltName: Full=UDP-ManNAc 6-dehydrogenase [Methanococcus vannielii SB]ABR55476.1 UDP-glucose/GDP-mannose dehydrogenase [Methanococcus vannielii SB]
MDKHEKQKIKKICVIGLGYIGLPTASMLANHGYEVIGVDISEKRVNEIKNGDFKIEEPGLLTLLKGAINSKNLNVKTKAEKADAFIICVPTPAIGCDDGSKKCDLSYVLDAVNSILPYIDEGNLIVIESTIPPETTQKIYDIIDKKVYVAHCPERVLPGKILKELVENDRIIGGINKKSAEMAKEIYKSFVEGKIYITDSNTAEMVKLMENTYRDINIALANEFAKICDEIGVNVWDAIKIANKHPRVNILNPGPGVGGHCISIDPWFIVEKTNNAKFIRSARELNDKMPYYVCNMIISELKNLNIEKPKVTVFGATYKGNVEDTRESPSKKVIDALAEKNIPVSTYDPHANSFEYELHSLEDSIVNSDCIVVLTDHNEFKSFKKEEIDEISKKLKNKLIIDTKNILNHNLWKKAGFKIKLLGNGAW